MNQNVEIRSAGAADFKPLCDLYCHSVRCNPQGFIQDLNYHGCLVQKARQWREAGGDMLVAVADGKLVGFGGLAPQTPQCVELCKLHVDPDRQRCGIGRSLTQALINHAEEAGFMEVALHVTVTQTSAISLYSRMGFHETGRNLFTTVVSGVKVSFDTLYMNLAIAL